MANLVDKELLEDPIYMDLLMARQPIYDTNSHLYGYELLFRTEDGKTAEGAGFDLATSQVVVNLCTSINTQFETLKQPLFINITKEFLLSDAFFPVEPEAVVLELLENTEVDQKVVEAVVRWQKKGFRFALDDYCFEEKFDPILPYMDFIKVDLLERPLDYILEKVKGLSTLDCKLIAEKVEDKVVLYKCREAGFDLFQGYHLAMPDKVFGKTIKPSYQGVIQVLQKVQSEGITVEELSRAVANEPRLVYQLLRILNSPACRLQRKVENIREAIVYLGITQLKKWTLLILLSSSSCDQTELIRILLTRARACERYAEMSSKAEAEKYFMAGLLSGIDLLLQVDKGMAMAQINVDKDIQNAILSNEGSIGKTLDSVFDIEDNELAPLGKLPKDDRRKMLIAHFEGGLWAHETLQAMAD